MSILWTRRQRCVDDDVGEDHVDEDLDDEVSALTLQRRVDDDSSLGGVLCGDEVSMPYRVEEVCWLVAWRSLTTRCSAR